MDNIYTRGQDFNSMNFRKGIVRTQSQNWSDPSQVLLKRSFDLFFSLVVMVLICSWLFPLIALFIKLGSEGPVVYKQLRLGKNQVPFYCFKFRTVRLRKKTDSQERINPVRTTKIGALLKKNGLVDLPQIYNVIRGDMSLVGPKPQALSMNKKASEKIEGFILRHAVIPGMTGLAQTKGFRAEPRSFFDIYSGCKLDLFYIKNWSFLLDLKILAWSMATVDLKNKAL